MITISNVQMARFRDGAEKEFLQRLASFVAIQIEKHAATMPPQQRFTERASLVDFVGEQVAIAKRYGFRTEYAFASFVVIRLFVYPDLVDRPFFHRLMADTATSADRNMERMMVELETREAWEV